MLKVAESFNHVIIGKYALLFLMLVTPFAHTVALRNLGILACLVYIVFEISKNGFEKDIPFKKAIVFWFLVAWASLFYSIDISHSLSELRHETLYTLIIFYASYTLVKQGLSIKLVLLTVLVGFCLMTIGVIEVYQYFAEWNSDYFAGVGNYSSYLVIFMPIFFYFFITIKKFPVRGVIFAFVILSLFAGFLSQNRMLWVVLIAELLIGVAIYLFVVSSGLRKKVGAIIISIIVIMASLLALDHVRKGADSLEEMFTADVRLGHWSKVLGIVQERPLYGLGFGKNLLGKSYPELMKENQNLEHAHNMILDYAVMAGIPGALAILVLFISFMLFFVRHFKTNPALASVAIIIISAVFLKNMSDNFFGRDQSLIVWALTGALSAALLSGKSGHVADISSRK
jgi:O-antigen ligase